MADASESSVLPTRLGRAARGFRGRVATLDRTGGRIGIDGDELERRLLEMGFIEGACVEVLHEGPIGRDPIAVRVDDATVALRRRDADMVLVAPERRAP